MNSARLKDSDFPREPETKLTHFALIGNVDTDEGTLFVAYMGYVLTGMPAPRGQAYIVFFDKNGHWIGKQRTSVAPLWCDGSLIYLAGIERYLADNPGNAWDLGKGFEKRELVLKPEYGSYVLIEEAGRLKN